MSCTLVQLDRVLGGENVYMEYRSMLEVSIFLRYGGSSGDKYFHVSNDYFVR